MCTVAHSCVCVCHLLLSVKCVIVEPLSVTAVDLLEHLTKSCIDQQHVLRMFSLLVCPADVFRVATLREQCLDLQEYGGGVII